MKPKTRSKKKLTKAQLARFYRETLPKLGARARAAKLTSEQMKAISTRGALAFTVKARLRALEREQEPTP